MNANFPTAFEFNIFKKYLKDCHISDNDETLTFSSPFYNRKTQAKDGQHEDEMDNVNRKRAKQTSEEQKNQETKNTFYERKFPDNQELNTITNDSLSLTVSSKLGTYVPDHNWHIREDVNVQNI